MARTRRRCDEPWRRPARCWVMARNSRRVGATLLVCAVLVVAGCAGPTSSSSPVAPTPRQTLSQGQARRYQVIADAGNRQLDTGFGGLAGRDRASLRRARADLADAAATERLFDRRLAAIPFAPATETIGRALYRRNQARAMLTSAAARSTTLAQLRWWQRRLSQANAGVEEAVRALRSKLGLPPPSTS
jgi:hypothetical protein